MNNSVKDNPTISVIVPYFNAIETIEACINSIFRQSYRVSEVIIVDDCSDDSESLEQILERYPDVVYIRNSDNLGLAASRNKGVQISQSDVISFLDSDDIIHPNKIELQLDVVKKGIATTCLAKRFRTDCELSGLALNTKFCNNRRKSVITSLDILWSNTLLGAALCLYKSDFVACGGYKESLRSCEDFELWFRLLRKGIVIKRIDCPLYFYRISEGSLSSRFDTMFRLELSVVYNDLFSFDDRRYSARIRRDVLRLWYTKHLIKERYIVGDSAANSVYLEYVRVLSPSHRKYMPIYFSFLPGPLLFAYFLYLRVLLFIRILLVKRREYIRI